MHNPCATACASPTGKFARARPLPSDHAALCRLYSRLRCTFSGFDAAFHATPVIERAVLAGEMHVASVLADRAAKRVAE